MALTAFQHTGQLLYTPQSPSTSSRIDCFRDRINEKYGLRLGNYEQLWQWSVDHIDQFWGECWEEVGIVSSRKWDEVVDSAAPIQSIPPWFRGAKLNWAENMLVCRSSTKVALVQATEPSPPTGPIASTLRRVTYAELYSLVQRAVRTLRAWGVKPGDRVGSYMTNCIENVVAVLATASIGAIWSSAAADFAPEGVVERFEQIQPKVLFSLSSVQYNGKMHAHIPKLDTVAAALTAKGIAPEKVVVVGGEVSEGHIGWDEFLSAGQGAEDGKAEGEIDFYQADFDQPLWILFSSGTTGKPKPILHRAGGMLLQAKKEHILHSNLTPDDVFFYFTTPGWMMWNYLVQGLSVGCTLVLYDGAPLQDPSILWRLAEETGMTVFGTSAKYLEVLQQKGYEPKKHHDISRIRQIQSTGSPLTPPQFDYVYSSISPSVNLASITGGTDLCSLFGAPLASGPVYRGEIQVRGLGMDVRSWDVDAGREAAPGQPGDLVCAKSFPIQPLGFWGEELGEKGKRYRESYYSQVEGMWYHGDYCILTPHRGEIGAGIVMLGRSDGILNPGGIRFGSSEIYDSLSSLPDASAPLVDSLVIGQTLPQSGDERVVLFVQLAAGAVLNDGMIEKIRRHIRERRSPRHVPERVVQVRDVPHTINGKKVEVPIKKIINKMGAGIAGINRSTLRNPECLEEYEKLGETLREEVKGR